LSVNDGNRNRDRFGRGEPSLPAMCLELIS
jgi:hypothetical protein